MVFNYISLLNIVLVIFLGESPDSHINVGINFNVCPMNSGLHKATICSSVKMKTNSVLHVDVSLFSVAWGGGGGGGGGGGTSNKMFPT